MTSDSGEERDTLVYEVRGSTCYITMNRPSALNALNNELREHLVDAFTRFKSDDSLLVAVLAGSGGRAFSAGADLKEMARELQESNAAGHRRAPAALGKMVGFDVVNECPKPVIAAIDGYCVGGGLELALYCDIRTATRHSTFGLPEPRIGRLAGPGLHNLSRVIPLGEALRLQLTGGTINAGRAYDIGLIQELAESRDELMEKVDGLAEEIAACAPDAVKTIKRMVKIGRNLPIEYAWYAAEGHAENFANSADALEGASAFAERRPARWKEAADAGRQTDDDRVSEGTSE